MTVTITEALEILESARDEEFNIIANSIIELMTPLSVRVMDRSFDKFVDSNVYHESETHIEWQYVRFLAFMRSVLKQQIIKEQKLYLYRIIRFFLRKGAFKMDQSIDITLSV